MDLEGFEYFGEYEEMFDWEWDINPDVVDIGEIIAVMTTIAASAVLVVGVGKRVFEDLRKLGE